MTLCRTATPDDLPFMLALYRHLNPADAPPADDAARAILERLLASDLTDPLVAEADGAVAGTCVLVTVPNLTRGGRPFAVIENVVTDPAFRRRGIGTALLDEARRRAWAVDCYKVMLATGRSEEAVLRFYESAGFMRGGKTHFEARRLD